MKEGIYFNYKKKGYKMLNYLEKTNISAIINILDIDNIKLID